MSDVIQLGDVAEGQKIKANGHEFTVIGVHSDNEGCQQWTLAVPQSRCIEQFNKKETTHADGR
jgi:hypothetical protein